MTAPACTPCKPNTAWARRKRLKRWAAQAMGRTRCPAMLTRGLRCGAPLTNQLRNGETVPFCARCDLKRQGLCIDCGQRPVVGAVGRGVRCGACRKLASHAHQRRYRLQHPGKVKQQWRARKARFAANPDLRARELEKKRAWKHIRPSKARAYKKHWQESEASKAYQRAYRARNRERIREKMRAYCKAKYGGAQPTHPCIRGCGAALVGRRKKCESCRAADRAAARALMGWNAA